MTAAVPRRASVARAAALWAVAACALPAAAAAQPASGPPGRPETEACVLEAAIAFDLPLDILRAIRRVEGGRVGETGPRNANGSHDIGPWQINSRWVSRIARDRGVPEASVRDALLWDGCYNAQVAAWLLSTKLDEAGGDFWLAVGWYNSRTPEHRDRYLARVAAQLRRILSDGPGRADGAAAR
jgi:hypothetical protein